MAGEVVRLHNDGETAFNDRYGGQRYIINPGQDAIVPWEAMCLWLGNPDFVDIDKKRRFRTDEYHRLRVRYGAHDDATRGITADQMWEQHKPAISVHKIDGSDERIITVVDDPSGSHLTPQTQTVAENELLRTRMEEMARQMAAMQAQMDTMDRAEAANRVSDADADAPTAPKRQPVPTKLPAPDPESGATEDSPTRVRVSR